VSAPIASVLTGFGHMRSVSMPSNEMLMRER
jgi:hypothetical protein